MQSESFEDTFTGCWAPTIKEEATTIKAEPADIYTSDDVSGAEQAKASMPSSGMDTNTVENRTIAAQASWTSQQHVSDEPMDGAGMFEIKREYSDNSLESHYHSPCNEEASATKPSQANLMMHPPVTEYPADAASGLHLKTEDPGLQECIHASYGCHETNSSMTAIQENRSSPLEQSSWTPQPSESAVDSTICPNIKTKDSVLPENLPQSNEYQHALCDGEIPATQPSYEQDSSQQPVKMETSEEMMYNDEHEESDSIDQSEESMLMTAQYGCSVAMLTDPSSAGPSSAQIGIATLHAARPQTPTSLSCPTCNQIFSCKDSLRSHEEIHSVMHCFICNICSKTFTKKCYLQKHIKRHSRTGQRFPCTTCNEAFDTSFHLKEHEATTHNKACALTPDDQNVAENADTSIVERPFQCDLCPLRFKTKNTLHSHREVHATIKPYACSKCGKDFIRQRGLKDHEQTHNSDGVFRCEKCPETFRNFTQLRLHRRKHSKLPQDAVQQNVPVTLVNSDMQVPGDQNAAENTDTLVPERPFECDLCPLRFKTKNTLHSHREVHATIKPYTCSKCGKAFIRQRGLKDHEQTHNPDGVFRCEKCPETFPNFNQLRFHRRMHSKLPQDAVQQNVPETLVNSDMQVPGDQNVPVNLVNSDMHVQVSETTEVVGQKQTCLNNNEALPANILSHAEAVPDMNVSSTLATNLGSAPFPCYYYPVTIMYPQVPSVIAVQNPLGMPFVCFPHNQSYGSSSILPEQISNNLIGNSLIGNSHSCDLCGCTFSDIEELNTHQKTHVQSAENLGNIDTSSPETTEFVGQTQNSANYKYELRERKLPHTCTEPALDSNSESTPEEKALEIEKLGYSQSCHLCGCTFSDIEKLSAHQKTHIQSAVPYTATDHAHQEVCTSRHDLVDEQLQVHTLDKSSQYSVLRDEVHSDLIPERPFQCELCPLRFKKKDTLKSHQDVHTGVKPYVCGTCGRAFARRSALHDHQQSHNPDGVFKCNRCPETFSCFRQLRVHQRLHPKLLRNPVHQNVAENLGNSDTSSPETTGFVGQTQNSADNKDELRERKLPHTCTEPALDSNSESTPEAKALEIEKFGNSQSCNLCGCTFSDIEKLSTHQKTHIQSAVPHTATDHAHQEVCTSRPELVDEQLPVHTLDKQSQDSVLHDEVLSDLIPERPFQCELCPLRFKKKDTLRSHQDVHTGVKPYVCGTCGRAFARRSTLLDHQQTHNPDGVFKCNRCPEIFSCFRQLRVHQRLHPKLLRNPVHQNVVKNLGNSDTSSKFEGQTQNSTDNKDELSEHKLLHTEAALTLEEHLLDIYQFACFFCSRICTQPSVLNRHIAQAHSSLESPFLCYVCNQSYNTTTSLREHVNYHRRGNSFKSYDCAISDDKLKTHEKTNNQSAIPSAACENVQNVSTNSSELHLDQQLLTNTLDTSPMHPVVLIKNHEATPSTAGKSGQNVCAKSFELDEQLPSPATLDKLLMESMKLMENSDEIHNQSAILSAASKHSHNVCIRSSESVDEHLRKVTFDKQFMDSVNRNVDQPDVPDERPFQCSLCPLRFKRKGNLRTHQEVHAAVKPYVCSTCGKAFIRQRSLRGHEQIHDQNRVYKCNRCSETFSRSRDLKIHRKIHSRPQNDGCQESVAEEPVNKDTQSTERPHQCHLCPLRFKRKGTLRSHQEVHATVKPYVCHKCGKTFTRKRSLQDHEQIHKDGLFKCEKCPETFSRFHHLKIHRRMHSRPQQDGCQETVVAEKPVNKETQSAERPYQCQLCPLRFKTKGTLSSHQEVHATVKPYVCNTCGKAFVRRSTLQDHEQTHNPDRVFKCKKCSETFSSSKDFKQHRKMHPKPSKVKTFRCDTCEKDFPTQRALVRHGYEHTQVKPFQCTQCSKGFLYEKSLQVHQKTHSEVRTYKCLLCKDRAFYTRVVLDAHMNYYHSESHDLRLFACNLCDKRYPSASSLAYHVLVHKNLKPFACHTCGKSYRSKMALKYHKKYHTGEKPSFFCDICKKGFLALFFLNRHKRESHSHRDRSFLCQYCDKTFTHSGRLSRHVAIHTRKNVLACKICGKTCLRKDNLRTHMKVHRPGRRKKTTHSDSD
ncbi:zinc finger protein 729-like isoform X2 [Patiria miniata]|nr:zinc finger protein 729-like isoform X2 [Patiria miniata]XP_038059512.1 zinc finger protein 729-like isoform X2 [Patiria miniata]XP_038059513.1 zinc finger protein 729-like isoform X2 [Patiria miniata]XP_038059514.1 zinc finger protein 729-like isoform X2 [Patiria miniata]